MAVKALFEKLQKEGEAYVPHGKNWKVFLPKDAETVVDVWWFLDDVDNQRGIELYYSQKYNIFIIRKWKYYQLGDSGSRLRLLKEEEAKEVLVEHIPQYVSISDIAEPWRSKWFGEEA